MSGQSFENQLPNQSINFLQRQNVNQQFGLNRQPPSLLNQQIPTAMQPTFVPKQSNPFTVDAMPQPTFQPRVPNVNIEPMNPLYPFGNTGGPFPAPMPQPTFSPSDGMPFGGIGGRPFASQQTPEDFQRMQDYRNQDLINQGIRANQGMPINNAQQQAPIVMPARGKR